VGFLFPRLTEARFMEAGETKNTAAKPHGVDLSLRIPTRCLSEAKTIPQSPRTFIHLILSKIYRTPLLAGGVAGWSAATACRGGRFFKN
jgi:hypothetical protein